MVRFRKSLPKLPRPSSSSFIFPPSSFSHLPLRQNRYHPPRSSPAAHTDGWASQGNLQELKIMAKKTVTKSKPAASAAPAKSATPSPAAVPAKPTPTVPVVPAPAAKRAPKPAAVKPKKVAAKGKSAANKSPTPKPAAYTRDDVALRAYFIAEKRQAHGLPGDEHQDWVEAERQLASESTRSRKAVKA